MASGLTIETSRAGDKTQVRIIGTVDEDASFGALEGLGGRVEINLKGIRRFNSVGIREWVNAIRPLGERANLIFVECSPAVITQLNMISGFLGQSTVQSFYAPMLCDRCDVNVDQLVRGRDCEDGIPPIPCPTCGADMVLDEVEDQYLLFLREPTRVG